jgi:hypothetical protein
MATFVDGATATKVDLTGSVFALLWCNEVGLQEGMGIWVVFGMMRCGKTGNGAVGTAFGNSSVGANGSTCPSLKRHRRPAHFSQKRREVGHPALLKRPPKEIAPVPSVPTLSVPTLSGIGTGKRG